MPGKEGAHEKGGVEGEGRRWFVPVPKIADISELAGECDPAISEALIRWAAINTITRRISRGGPGRFPAAWC